ncbi:MAG: Uma2 family endonuclease [Bacteroidota bacterium]
MVQKETTTFTIEEYLAIEKKAVVRHEYSNGQIATRNDGTLNHSQLTANMSELLGILTENRDCGYYDSNLRVYLEKANSLVYTDGMLICGDPEISTEDEHAVINPSLVIEVLSEYTEYYDRGEKFRKYRTLNSFKEYLLIDQYQPIVDVFCRASANVWEMRTVIGLDKSIPVDVLDCSIPLEDIYSKVEVRFR